MSRLALSDSFEYILLWVYGHYECFNIVNMDGPRAERVSEPITPFLCTITYRFIQL